MEKDPVCGMDVDPKTTSLTSSYQGKNYYFCSPGCKTAFDKEPQKYISKPVKPQSRQPHQPI